MSTSSREHPADPLRLAAVALLVEVVDATASRATTWRNLGTLLHQRYVARDNCRPDITGSGEKAPVTEPRIPLRFTLRDGWTSQQLREHIADACALGALDTERGGVLKLGPTADVYLGSGSTTVAITRPHEEASRKGLLRIADESGATGR